MLCLAADWSRERRGEISRLLELVVMLVVNVSTTPNPT